ncbi:transcriptional repressor [Trichothermofontia sichuanensis B231]|uniref:Fur family transcriptional regulator n=1 Tax=Trichothermofontia sichuanensis TaxID=3045816 RepID=UPI002245D776|nr:Fur family transcriptional regulator [Trichothermofontia sichuanensis]UZQ53288.1 transcriptional repressor [Trichothermofontia sichuanensis B231]
MENTQSNGERFKARLHQEGLRFTRQRQKILDLFQDLAAGQHLSAEEIQQTLAQQGERISLSTVYRTLHVMARVKLLRELELAEGKKLYELSAPFLSQHHHLVCVQCGAVVEFEADKIRQVGGHQSAERGYALLDCQFTLYGICPQCQRQTVHSEE